MAKKNTTPKRILNRRARHDYDIDDTLLVGIALTGAETKALRMGHGQLQGAYVTTKDNELWLINAAINGAPGVPISEDQVSRSRKLLAKQKEIDHLIAEKRQGNTILPLEILTQRKFIKLRIAAGRGKKLYDKRQTLKARDEKRHIQAALKQRGRTS
jgi:SsrA-binding protein